MRLYLALPFAYLALYLIRFADWIEGGEKFEDQAMSEQEEKCGRCGRKDIKTLDNGWKECQYCGSYCPQPLIYWPKPKPQETK